MLLGNIRSNPSDTVFFHIRLLPRTNPTGAVSLHLRSDQMRLEIRFRVKVRRIRRMRLALLDYWHQQLRRTTGAGFSCFNDVWLSHTVVCKKTRQQIVIFCMILKIRYIVPLSSYDCRQVDRSLTFTWQAIDGQAIVLLRKESTDLLSSPSKKNQK